MDKNQKELINTYLRKRKIADKSYREYEIIYLGENNLIKEKIDASEYFPLDIVRMIVKNKDLIKYFTFYNVEMVRIQNLLLLLNDQHKKYGLSAKDFNTILLDLFKTVDINKFDLTNINWLRNYFPILEPYYINRYNDLYNHWSKTNFKHG